MRFVRLENCTEGMVVGKTIFGINGMMLLRYGTVVRQSHIDTLLRMGYAGMYIDDAISAGIDIPEVVDRATQAKAQQALENLFAESKLSKITNTARMVKDVEGVLGDIIKQIITNRDMVANITSLKTFDGYTFQHCVDVCVLSLILGREFQMNRKDLENLGKTAIFHDIAKMFVSQNLLNKPSRLTPEEYEEIKKHSQLGYDCLKNLLNQPEIICEGVLYHHERYEGGGYPSGREGNEIPIYARIIALTDVYDAITSKRAYKDAMIATEAYEYIMGNIGKHFDPLVVNAFLRKIPPFPVGSGIILSDGRKAIVAENKPSFMTRPIVRIVNEGANEAGDFVDLANDADARSVTIVGSF